MLGKTLSGGESSCRSEALAFEIGKLPLYNPIQLPDFNTRPKRTLPAAPQVFLSIGFVRLIHTGV